MSDKIKLKGVYEQGYGLSPKMVMRDKELSIEAKAIYAYMASFAGNGESAFPRVETICRDLNISENRFRKHREDLLNKSYITIKRNRKEGMFYNNVYTINHTIPSFCQDGESSGRQNDSTTNNKVLTNNKDINSNSSPFDFYQQNFGVLNPFMAEKITHWINDLNEELVIESMKKALNANRKFNYAEGILKDWLNNNIKNLADVEAKEREFTRSKGTKRGEIDIEQFQLDD